MRVVFTHSAFRQFKKLGNYIQKRIDEKLILYTSQSNPLRFADKLQDLRFGSFRFRVGDYRILFDIQGDLIVILKVGHRKDVYK
ncbi:MAG: type II toxin-antitoxin system RelE/ParE family toxin [Candidatus Vogelbacteria bacterium]|nr:type II toxin-antitoxin system RelE/ParE family toxin [Candidatus Vogelbacteria bacterium]